MPEAESATRESRSIAGRLVFWLSVFFVVLGMINAMPGIPGLDQLAVEISGNPDFIIRKFPFEYYYPFAFAVMMLIVALHHSIWRA
ncbi:MAG: C4-dicarboxylate ABC transporter, partial [Boseongicola sp.]|nr:C4-dicarboxylate ABC transporter [Boseongicola sp.]